MSCWSDLGVTAREHPEWSFSSLVLSFALLLPSQFDSVSLFYYTSRILSLLVLPKVWHICNVSVAVSKRATRELRDGIYTSPRAARREETSVSPRNKELLFVCPSALLRFQRGEGEGWPV